MTGLRATARLQFHKDFTIDQACELVPYFESLGISHLYASPLLKSRPGSTHGYDIVDHHAIDPELGGILALQRLVGALRDHGMGLILDIVPNHMGVGGADNAWWLDVLEWGRASPYADYFDIDWDPPDATLRGRLLAPFLGSSYGEALEAGDLVLQFDRADGRLYVCAYGAHRFPIDPRQYATVLQEQAERLPGRDCQVQGGRRGYRHARTCRRGAHGAAGGGRGASGGDRRPCSARLPRRRRRVGTGCTGCSNARTTGSPGGGRRRTRSTGGGSSTSTASPASAPRKRRCLTTRTTTSCASTARADRRRAHRSCRWLGRSARLLPQAQAQAGDGGRLPPEAPAARQPDGAAGGHLARENPRARREPAE